jgi:hypothetical protein
MKADEICLRSPGAFHKWADERRANVWYTIEKFEAGEVSPREAHEILRQEKKALSAMGRRLSGLRRARVRK